MGWSKDSDDRSGGRRGYHHGNLREALVDAARDLIRESGAGGFSFAEAARLAGVSPAAPYRHFKDRDELIAEVARVGFERFADALAKGWNDGHPTATAAYQAMSRAYLAFARDNPADLAAMFDAGLPIVPGSELAQASERAFSVLRNATEVVVATLPVDRRPPVMMMSLHIWSLAHGIATLFARGDAARRRTPISPDDLMESALLIYFQGLGTGDGS